MIVLRSFHSGFVVSESNSGDTILISWRGAFGTATLAIRPMTMILPAPPPVSRDKHGVPGITELKGRSRTDTGSPPPAFESSGLAGKKLLTKIKHARSL